MIVYEPLPDSPPLTNPVTLPAGSVNKAMAKSPMSINGTGRTDRAAVHGG
jgi:hypothetical protein